MKVMTALLMTMLVMVVGSYLISPVNTAVAAITTPTYSASVSSLSGLFPLLMVVVVILYPLDMQLSAVMLIENGMNCWKSKHFMRVHDNQQPSRVNGSSNSVVTRKVQRLEIEDNLPIISQIASRTLLVRGVMI